MRTVIVFGLLLVLAGVTQAKGLRFRAVDADSGTPIAGATFERRASQWQPCTIPWFGAKKFWFPEDEVTTDREGFASLEKVARDDRYIIKAEGYEPETVARGWFKVQFAARAEDAPREVTERSGVLIVPLQRSSAKAANQKMN